ncbi:MAG: methionine synthase [Phycisphaerales bacterium]|nr:methionine synthase [Phycisphaerales bacterium]
MASPFLQHLSRRILVCDGGMGTQIHKVPLTVDGDYCGCENCTDILVATRPDVIQKIHEDYLLAGADCIETDSFGSAKLVLGEFGIAERCFELSRKAAEVGRAAADKHSTSDKPRFVIGSMGPGTKLITLGNTNWETMFDSYREQARGLLAGGVDAFIIETCQDLLQIKCAINAVLAALEEKGKSPFDVPILVSVTIETTGTMLLGSSIEAAAQAVAQYPIVSLGLNCATGPNEMSEHVHFLGKHWGRMGAHAGRIPGLHNRATSVMPNAGLPVLVEGRTEYPLQPQPFVEAMLRFIEHDGVNFVGGCCGTTPEHIKLLNEAVSGRRAAETPRTVFPVGVTSLYSSTDYRQDNSFLIVGERMNASGSRAFKKLLEQEDWDSIVSLAKEQLREGAHVLDLNVDYAGRDNAKDMEEIVRRVVRQVDAPLMVDSTQIKTIEAGLKHAAGKCIINSANFEDGEEKFDAIIKLAKTYGSAVVIGSIDEDKQASMARTAERKFAIAARAFERATGHWGMHPADILFDPLVLPISTGMESDRRSALELVDGIKQIAEKFPESQTVVGLSNASFGLSPPARLVLNSALLHELREVGLTAAIVHAGKILPRNKILDEQWNAAIELIYDRRRDGFDPLQAFIDLFKDVQATAAVKKDKSTLTVEDRLREHIIDGEKQGLKETIDQALGKYKPLDIINDHLLDGMKTVGELFGSGKMQLPFVLQSAEVMKMAVSQLEPLMERAAGQTKGTIVLATVKGDVHDIGKNLVDIILTNNGYKVVNLGIKQPLHAMIDAWKEHKADAIGMSGLLVKSVNVMEENIKEINGMPEQPPLLLGGAALTRHYCESHLRDTYEGDCYYGKDAFEGLRTMDMLMTGKSGELLTEIESRQSKRTAAEETILKGRIERSRDEQIRSTAAGSSTAAVAPVRSSTSSNNTIPAAPFFGSRIIEGISLDEVFGFINPIALFRGQWQFKKGSLSDDDYEHLVADEVKPIYDRIKTTCKEKKLLLPKVVYGYFPCNADGDDLVIWDPEEGTGHPALGTGRRRREIERIRFPRQPDKKRLCISDFFRPLDSGHVDVIGMHCVTMGHRISEYTRELFSANNYTEYLYFHGIGVEAAEALAELWHKRMRQELGIANEDSPRIKELFTQHYRGSRYSFGYPACPDLSDQEKLFRLLKPDRIGCQLTENWQIDPEQSTSAIIVHHPEAKYFNV